MAPRINASGRLADASLPIELLLDDDYQACRERAKQLDTMNRERRLIERAIVQEAEARAERDFTDAPGVVLYGADWHPGVVGIVASRVSRRFNKPCVILGAEGELAKGSGRSVHNVNLVEILQRCADLLGHWGGHPMAVGVSLQAEEVEAFTQRFVESLAALHPNGLPEPSLRLSAWLELEQVSETLLEQLDRLRPFGQGNSEPVFGLRGVVLQDSPQAFGENNFRLRLPAPAGDGRGLSGVAWRLGEAPLAGQPIDLAVRLSWNFWRNQRSPQITVVDWRPSEDGSAVD
jgi:single-stranded-DNA-specific exonuclease